jgi:tRNA nucleotidyltransferase (CCA-adding enzyme)
MIDQNRIPSILLKIAKDIHNAGGLSFLVGGWVRDSLLGVESKDFDIEVHKISETQLLSILKKYGKAGIVGRAFGVYHFRVNGQDFDFSFPRTEAKVGAGHKGFVVRTDPSLNFEQASQRRDFTINAMGMRLPDLKLEDPHNGQIDLKNKILRHVGPAFGEDPLRALRAVQFAARFELEIAQKTKEICREQDLSELSKERFMEEFKKLLLKARRPAIGLKVFRELNLDRFFPELGAKSENISTHYDLLNRLAIQKSGDEKFDLVLLFSGLCWNMEPLIEVPSFLNRLGNDKQLLRGVKSLLLAIREFQQWIDAKSDLPNDPWFRRLSLKTDILMFDFFIKALFLASSNTQQAQFSESITQKIQTLGLFSAIPRPLLSGDWVIKQFRLSPGPEIGALVKECFEAQLEGEVKTEEEAHLWCIAKLKK